MRASYRKAKRSNNQSIGPITSRSCDEHRGIVFRIEFEIHVGRVGHSNDIRQIWKLKRRLNRLQHQMAFISPTFGLRGELCCAPTSCRAGRRDCIIDSNNSNGDIVEVFAPLCVRLP